MFRVRRFSILFSDHGNERPLTRLDPVSFVPNYRRDIGRQSTSRASNEVEDDDS